MNNYFRTDGIRGLAQLELCPDLFYNIGTFLALKNNRPVIVCRDTRESSSLYYSMLISGVRSLGIDVWDLGVGTTPLLAWAVKRFNPGFGAMITASHNPFRYNGIKIFAPSGDKIGGDLQEEASEFIRRPCSSFIKSVKIGKLVDMHYATEEYLDHLVGDLDFSELGETPILFDAANGGGTELLVSLVKKIGLVRAGFVGVKPNGRNINDQVGSLATAELLSRVKAGKFELGLALDGDGDRCVAATKKRVLDGDLIAYLLLSGDTPIKHDSVVVTQNTNGRIIENYKELGIKVIISEVGDTMVLQKMKEKRIDFGYEPSGHFIFEYEPSDGLKTMLKILTIFKKDQKRFLRIASTVKMDFCCKKNYEVKDQELVLRRYEVENIESKLQSILKESGRVLVRKSGTEKMIRFLAESSSKSAVDRAKELFDSFMENF